MSELILASSSPARRELMDSLRLPYRVLSPKVDERVPRGVSASEIVRELAYRKAVAVCSRHPRALVIGADQVASGFGKLLRKPASRSEARRQLQRLSGRAHQILTGVCLLGPGIDERHVEVSRLTMYPISADELERYLDLGEWRGCAGGYRIESAGQALFARIEGDRTNVQGLPMVLLVRLLRKAGVAFFSGRDY